MQATAGKYSFGRVLLSQIRVFHLAIANPQEFYLIQDVMTKYHHLLRYQFCGFLHELVYPTYLSPSMLIVSIFNEIR